MDIGYFNKFSKKIINTAILIVIIVILFCSFTVSKYFFKVKLEETNDNISNIVENFDRNKNNIIDVIDEYPIYNSIIQVLNTSEDIIISKKKFTKEIDYGNFTEKDMSRALEPYKEYVLNGNSISKIINLSEVNKNVIVIGQPLEDKNGNVVGAIFALKFTKEFYSVLMGLNIVLSFSITFILVLIMVPFYLIIKKTFGKINNITEMVIDMSKGDYSIRFDKYDNEQLDKLSDSLNKVAIILEQTVNQSKLLEQTRRDYVANVSHELKTPVTSIRAMAEILKDGSLVDKVDKDKYYSMILRESIRLESLIKDMLELSKLQSGKESLEKKKVRLNETLLQVIEEFKVISEDLDIELIIDIDFDNLPEVYTNINRIAQVLVILVDNAFKYTSDNGSVTLKVLKQEDYIKVSVCDTGIGVEEEDIPFIFDRFYQADKSHSSEGTGIGLSIAWEIMKNLDENIYYESNDVYQSIFNFTIHYE